MDVRHQISLKIIDAIGEMVDEGIVVDGPEAQKIIIDGVCLAMCSLMINTDNEISQESAVKYFNEMFGKIKLLKSIMGEVA